MASCNLAHRHLFPLLSLFGKSAGKRCGMASNPCATRVEDHFSTFKLRRGHQVSTDAILKLNVMRHRVWASMVFSLLATRNIPGSVRKNGCVATPSKASTTFEALHLLL
ncbi:hypothetical protein F5141DRAFT_463131 [Pisolithus sp. B1]|nr:hypothetical protein F5141DRAFT_463131 [Pisolithus sp. B1]